jgi:hypothetical protein
MSEKSEMLWIVSPLKGVSLRGKSEVALGDGLALMRTDERLLASRSGLYLGSVQFHDIGRAPWFLVLRVPQSPHTPVVPDSVELLLDALMAFQIVKPIETYGLAFHGDESSAGDMNWHGIDDRRWPMNAGQWSQLRMFDEPLLNEVLAILNQVRSMMRGPDISKRNAVHLLQLALEHPHQYVACLLAVTGIEAILDCKDRWDFEKKLCDLLGASALAFPDWNSPDFPPLTYTVKEVAVHLYTLRSKVAHGADLAKAAHDKNTPVDLLQLKEYILEGAPVRYATLLCESSIYILGQVLQKVL